MNRILLLVVVICLVVIKSSNAYIFEEPAFYRNSDLTRCTPTTHWSLDVRLCIRDAEGNPGFVLDGLQVKLLPSEVAHSSALDTKKQAIDLPSSRASLLDHDTSTSRPREAEVTGLPFFVGMNGKQNVELAPAAAWEIATREDALAGSLVLGLHVPNEAARNSVKLPKGGMFLCFPFFSEEMLIAQQECKDEALKEAARLRREKDEKLAEMEATNNFFKKALLYREAMVAYENMMLTGIEYYDKWVPSREEDDNVVKVEEGLVAATQGAIWTGSKDVFGQVHLETTIGEAFIRNNPRESPASAPGKLRP